jgi:predicted DNA-binding protein (UPF0251 family)
MVWTWFECSTANRTRRNEMRTVINFRHLEAIRAVMMSGSVTGAGERLHVTQSAISHLLRDAEERLGYSLFERHLGWLTPTCHFPSNGPPARNGLRPIACGLAPQESRPVDEKPLTSAA